MADFVKRILGKLALSIPEFNHDDKTSKERKIVEAGEEAEKATKFTTAAE